MKTLLLSLGAAALTLAAAGAADTPLLALPGEVIYQSPLDAPLAAPWKVAKGRWQVVDGVLRGSELAADKHGAVARLPEKLADFIVEYEFKFEGARTTSLSINAVKDHMARILITPKSVTVQRDDNDHEGPDKAVVFARLPAEFAPGTWHKVRLEMVGDLMLGRVDGLTAWGQSDLFKTPKTAPGFTVGGESVDFRNLSIRRATLNPGWEAVKAGLPKPGEKVAPLPGRAAKGKGKAKKKAVQP